MSQTFQQRDDLEAMEAMVGITSLRDRRAALQWVASRYAADERKVAALEAVFGWLRALAVLPVPATDPKEP